MVETPSYSKIVKINMPHIANLQAVQTQLLNKEINKVVPKKIKYIKKHSRPNEHNEPIVHKELKSPIIMECATKQLDKKTAQLEPEINDISIEFKSIKDITTTIFERVYNLESNLKTEIKGFRNEQLGFKLQQSNYKDIELNIKNKKAAFETEKSAFETEKSAFETEKSAFETEKSAFETEKSAFETESHMVTLPPNILGFRPHHIVDFSTLNIQEQDMFNIETINIFTMNQLCWILPTNARVGDLIVFKNAHIKLELLVRIYCILPAKNINLQYTLFGDTCVCCCKP
jgi:hypothetical protein